MIVPCMVIILASDLLKEFVGGIIGADTDYQNRIVCTLQPDDSYKAGLTRHGPAVKTVISVKSNELIVFDTVFAFKGNSWPSYALEWLTRNRKFNWPSSDLINKCTALGFLVVPVGHLGSNEEYLQWRVSFPEQERMLVAQFNSVQLKCFVLLKLIKEDIIHSFIGVETLTSYHCKTCMFYMIEKTPSSFWKPHNLLTCVVACLKTISVWVQENNCPNYFIATENILTREYTVQIEQNYMKCWISCWNQTECFFYKFK